MKHFFYFDTILSFIVCICILILLGGNTVFTEYVLGVFAMGIVFTSILVVAVLNTVLRMKRAKRSAEILKTLRGMAEEMMADITAEAQRKTAEEAAQKKAEQKKAADALFDHALTRHGRADAIPTGE